MRDTRPDDYSFEIAAIVTVILAVLGLGAIITTLIKRIF